jgi:AraC family L-rhamnose operon regulatory protein RhaS
MAVRIPLIYQKANSRWEIDSCQPQLDAWRSGKIEIHALSKGHYLGDKLLSTQLPGISNIGFWNGISAQDWGLDPHRNEGLEICFLETGAMAFSVGAKKYELHSGHFTLTRPWQLHKLGAPNIGPGKLHWLILDVGVRRPNQKWRWPRWLTLTEADKAQLTRKLSHNENAVWNASPAIADTFCSLSNCVLKWKEPHSESRMIALLNQLLLEILIVLTRQKSQENPDLASRRHTVKLFLQDLAQNEAGSNQPWTLEKMATHCGMGITAFSKYCRELVNRGPMEHFNQCRLEHAAQMLLKHPDFPVIEVAFKCGFNSSQYFATVFRRRFRVTPRKYRQQEKKNRASGVSASVARLPG